MKMLCYGIKGIINIKPGNIEAISYFISRNGSKLSDPVKIATEFNKYFTIVANSITKQIPGAPKSSLDYLSTPNLELFFISASTPDEVSTLIKSLKLGKPNSEPNSIPLKLLKILQGPISSDLAFLINESFVSGIFPDTLKIAKVVPIFKKGLALMTSSYRPISLVSVLSNFFEKIMHQQL